MRSPAEDRFSMAAMAGGDRYQTDGEVEISRLAEGCGSRVASAVKLDNPVAVKIKNRVWRAIVRTLRTFS